MNVMNDNGAEEFAHLEMIATISIQDPFICDVLISSNIPLLSLWE
ncbi:manganese catalase family protein [Paenibacillus sp. DMB20]|nr:manganese catalase family protein [Paenibacillus sp. DMB20]